MGNHFNYLDSTAPALASTPSTGPCLKVSLFVYKRVLIQCIYMQDVPGVSSWSLYALLLSRMMNPSLHYCTVKTQRLGA